VTTNFLLTLIFKMGSFVICLPSHIDLCGECCKKHLVRQLPVSMTIVARRNTGLRREVETLGVCHETEMLSSSPWSYPLELQYNHLKS
jgi:hypothetical protein